MTFSGDTDKRGIFQCKLMQKLSHKKDLSTELYAAQFNVLHQWYFTTGPRRFTHGNEPNLISLTVETKLVSSM